MGSVAYPLTRPQQSIWNMEQFYGGAVAGITGCLMFTHYVLVGDIQTALNQTIQQYDSLRLHIQMFGSEPMQYVDDFAPAQFPIERFNSDIEFETWAQTVARVPIDLAGSLYRVFIVEVENRTGVLFHLHHLTADAWTLGLLASSLRRNLMGEPVTASSYLSYLSSEAEYLASPRAVKDSGYFRDCFHTCDEPVYLADKPAIHPDSERFSTTISADDSAALFRFCADHEVTPYALMMTALAIYFGRVKRTSQFYLGTTVLNRADVNDKQTAGVFINTVPVLFELSDDATILETLENTTQRLVGVFRHQRCSYIDTLKNIRQDYGFSGRLFDVVLNYQNATLDGDDMTAKWYFCGSQGDTLAIHVNDRQREGVFHLDYGYQTDSLNRRQVERLHDHLITLLLDMTEHPDKRPWQLKLLSDEEYKQVTVDFNDTAADYQRACVHQLIERQAERAPHVTAVVYHGESYSYGQINAMANGLAMQLKDAGVGRGDIVAIMAKRSHRIIVAQLAVLKVGGAYLPIDPAYPRERIAFMLADANCRAALVDGAEIDGLPVIDLRSCDKRVAAVNLPNLNEPDDLCYVIYTSGSTGRPKGVMIRHRNIANYCANNSNNVVHSIVTPEMITILSTTTMCFDIFATESILALVNAKTVIMADEQQCVDQRALDALCLQTQPDVLQTTPSKMRLLTQDETSTGYLRGLKAIILGGEALDTMLVDRLRQFTDANLFNIYGPTETTVWSTSAAITSSVDLTIGKPIANTQVYILDGHLSPLPIGAMGELFIGGDGVGAGYLNRPHLTAEKFRPNPFHSGTMYATGDLARWRENGNVEYIGRTDHQVKLHGLRIELGEIEARLAECPGVRQCAVVLHDSGGRQYLCAYYTGEAEVPDLKEALARNLPQYMVPNSFVRLASLPTTPSGKLDRKALPPPDEADSHSIAAYAPPRTYQERILASLVQTVLGVDRVGRDDDFFDLGGDSLSAIELITKAHAEGFGFSLQDVFDRRRVSALLKPAAADAADVSTRSRDISVDHQSKINALLARNQGVPKLADAPRQIGNVLITGTTGWLGSHVLDEYLRMMTGTAYCLVRAANLATATARLIDVLHAYFGRRYDDSPRVVPVVGDITESLSLPGPVSTIIHCAADVRHYGSWQMAQLVNVEGTKNIITLAQSIGARLLHISTMTVSGNGLTNLTSPIATPVFDETRLDIGQSLDNIYVRSKFDAEVAVLNARLAGLEAQIARVGNLSNRYSDLAFQRDFASNTIAAILKALVDAGCYPVGLENLSLEFSPVDATASALLALLSHTDPYYSVFHVGANPVRFTAFTAASTHAGLLLEPVEDATFTARLAHVSMTGPAQIALGGGVASLFSGLAINNDFTTRVLTQAGFEWPTIGSDYLDRYVSHFTTNGYWRPHENQQ